jgi:hydroxymethylpyrimidine pyrophosphatase-like HAD family hydrolase
VPRSSSRRYKLIAVDLDGTLLDHRGVPHERDVRALKAAQHAGIHVSILTGRLYSGTRASAEAIGIVGPVGCADGSHIVRVSDHRTLLHHARGEVLLPYVRTWSQDVRPTTSIETHDFWSSDEGVTAVVAVGTAEQIHGTSEEIERALGTQAQIATFPVRRLASTWGLVARAAGGTKGTALAYLAEHHRCAPEETVCVGDWLNDVSMFSAAGRSYAMGHAPDEVKRLASAVLPETSERGGGIARVVEELFEVRVE